MNSRETNGTTVYPMDSYGFRNDKEEPELNATNSYEAKEEDATKQSSNVFTLFTQESGLSGVKYIGDANAAKYRR